MPSIQICLQRKMLDPPGKFANRSDIDNATPIILSHLWQNSFDQHGWCAEIYAMKRIKIIKVDLGKESILFCPALLTSISGPVSLNVAAKLSTASSKVKSNGL